MLSSAILGAGGALAGAAMTPLLYFVLGLDVSLGSPLVGALVGLGVALGQRGQHCDGAVLVLTASLTISGSVLATLGTVAMVYFGPSERDQARAETVDAVERMFASDEGLSAAIAADLVVERTAAGETLAWPPGKSAESAFRPDDFPPDIRDAARDRAASMSDAERQAIVDSLVAELRRHAELADATLNESLAGLPDSRPTPDTMVKFLMPYIGPPDILMLVVGTVISLSIVQAAPFGGRGTPDRWGASGL